MVRESLKNERDFTICLRQLYEKVNSWTKCSCNLSRIPVRIVRWMYSDVTSGVNRGNRGLSPVERTRQEQCGTLWSRSLVIITRERFKSSFCRIIFIIEIGPHGALLFSARVDMPILAQEPRLVVSSPRCQDSARRV